MSTATRRSSSVHRIGLYALAFVVASVFVSPSHAQTTFTVDTVSPLDDESIGDGTCSTFFNTCSLRAALQEANASTGTTDRIEFAVPTSGAATIQATATLEVTDPVVIDGTTAPAYAGGDSPVIAIDGGGAGTDAHGINVTASAAGSTIRGLSIVGFDGNGIRLTGALGSTVVANDVGLEPDGTPNGNGRGIVVLGNGAVIGPDTRGANSNVVVASEGNGIVLGRDGVTTADDNVVQNNFVGVVENTTTTFANNVGIQVDEGSGNAIDGNVVGGNVGGISVSGASFENTITGNFVGVGSAGQPMGNTKEGIFVRVDGQGLSKDNDIGGTGPQQPNTVGNNTEGIVIEDGAYHSVVGNYVGTDVEGGDIGNAQEGILVQNNPFAVIGGAGVAGNVVGFNGDEGIDVIDSPEVDLLGNSVGVHPLGTAAGNGAEGIRLSATSGANSVDVRIGYGPGDTLPDTPTTDTGGSGNVIAHNTGAGIAVEGPGTVLTDGIRGNAFFANDGPAIDLGNDGPTSNDAGDGDVGVNRLQNFPEIDASASGYDASADVVTVRYRVDCTVNDSGGLVSGCAYGSGGLAVDFYAASTEGGTEGRTYLGTHAYLASDAQTYVTASFTPPSSAGLTASDDLLAIVTDAYGSTSEFTDAATDLPVELASFDGRAASDRVVLTWTTLSETGNAGFDVERKGPDGAFRSIGFRNGAGTTTETMQYTFETEALAPGAHTFRLRQVDVDGRAHVSDPVTVTVRLDERVVLSTPSPNPVRGRTTVRIGTATEAPVELVLFDALGRRVRTLFDGVLRAGAVQTRTLDLGGLTSGRYFLRLQSGDAAATQSVTVVR